MMRISVFTVMTVACPAVEQAKLLKHAKTLTQQGNQVAHTGIHDDTMFARMLGECVKFLRNRAHLLTEEGGWHRIRRNEEGQDNKGIDFSSFPVEESLMR